MSLRRKMALQIGATIVGLLLTIVTSLWGLNGLRQDYTLALRGYAQLRQLFEVGSHLATAGTLITSTPPDRAAAGAQVDQALARFELGPAADGIADAAATWNDEPASASADIHAALLQAAAQLRRAPEQNLDMNILSADEQAVSSALSRVGTVAAGIRHQIEQSQQAAQNKRRDTMIAMGVVSMICVLWAIGLGIWQYRGVIHPLQQLRESVRRLASAEFTGRVDEVGAEEFAALAREFNRMATELHGFYAQLEQKVAQKSRELVRSERLASVGFLAAGVAHEINNPLSVISGYAEHTLAQIRAGGSGGNAPSPADSQLLQVALQTICDEAFRCKDITGKLLSLARGGDTQRKAIDLGTIASQVGAMVGALHDYRDRSVRVVVDEFADLQTLADEAEMKQVVLNLTINALEATAHGSGQVAITVQRRDAVVELAVSDNGRGMTPQVLDRVFEPFFTHKSGTRAPGTGLGLSITHVIIENHAGTIRAQSAGPGTGSRFVVELPAVNGADATPTNVASHALFAMKGNSGSQVDSAGRPHALDRFTSPVRRPAAIGDSREAGGPP